MKRNLQLSIQNPCHEDWEAMTPQARGRFCASCTKVVTDFSNMTDSQILEFLKTKQGTGCGNFNNEQLNRPLIPAMVHKNNVWRRAFIALAVTFMALPRLISKPSQVLQKGNMKVKIQSQLKPVAGQILDAATKKPIAGVKVKLVENSSQTYSDSTGKFTITADRSDTAKLIKLLLEKEGYAPVEYDSESGKIGNNLVIEMNSVNFTKTKDNSMSGPKSQVIAKPQKISIRNIFNACEFSVTDGSSKPIPGAEIVVFCDSLIVKKGVTDRDGMWMAIGLDARKSYTIKIIKSGFLSYENKNYQPKFGKNEKRTVVLNDATPRSRILTSRGCYAVDRTFSARLNQVNLPRKSGIIYSIEDPVSNPIGTDKTIEK